MRGGAVVAAAGRSRRMGAEKILLPFGSSTVLEAILASISAAGVRDVVVVTRPDLERARRLAARAGARIVENPEPEAELLSSIRLGVSSLDPSVEAFFVWPADHPLVAVETAKRLLAGGSPEIALIPAFEGRRGHPALVGRMLRSAIVAGSLLPGGLRQLWRERAEAVRELEVHDRGVVLDINTPEDYQQALALLASRGDG